jgi:putative hydrolase of HD superfamily
MKREREIEKLDRNIKNLVNFIFEYRILKHLPRASLPYLKGPVKENVAEHSFYTVIISWILAKLEKADEEKVIKMALIHDLAEVRGGERNLINKFYTQPLNELNIINEISKEYKLGDFELEKIFKEFFEEKTLEARIVKDADVLAGMLLEKECFDLGNKKAKKWLVVSSNRLKLKSAKSLGKSLIETDSEEWWIRIAKRYIRLTKFL